MLLCDDLYNLLLMTKLIIFDNLSTTIMFSQMTTIVFVFSVVLYTTVSARNECRQQGGRCSRLPCDPDSEQKSDLPLGCCHGKHCCLPAGCVDSVTPEDNCICRTTCPFLEIPSSDDKNQKCCSGVCCKNLLEPV